MKLTDARRRALLVLLHGERTNRTVYESNKTTPPSDVEHGALMVYWQSRAWLEREGLLASRTTSTGVKLSLTPEGYRAALELAGERV